MNNLKWREVFVEVFCKSKDLPSDLLLFIFYDLNFIWNSNQHPQKSSKFLN